MGNYLLQETLARMADFTPGNALPRIFEQVFPCAPDVDDTALEAGQPLGKIDQITRHVTVYHNRGDAAMVVSDYTKGQPERLGGAGAAHPQLLHNKVCQVDCTPVLSAFVEHSYYLVGNVLADIRSSIAGWAQNDARRQRLPNGVQGNNWTMK
jgi:esterase/lipase superfamily enzyme